MDAKERRFSELQTVCKGAGLDFEKTSRELLEFIGSDEVIHYYIVQEPMPSFPDTLFDVMILSDKSLCDYEVKRKGVLLHVLPLRGIIEVGERFAGEEDEFLAVHFSAPGLGVGLATESRLSESGNLRRFSAAVRKKILESI